MDNAREPRIVQWLLDTRSLWKIPNPSSNPKDDVQKLNTIASKELSLLIPTEAASVLKYYHLRDAKMSLASHLLKHFIITKYLLIPWEESIISRDEKGKPCFVPTHPEQKRIDFNISHQAGLVSLIAAVGFEEKVDVGTDIVCWNERAQYDNKHIEKEGLFDWIDMHAEVFAASEVSHMKFGPLDELGQGKDVSLKGFAKDVIARVEKRDGSVDVKVESKNGDGKKRVVQISRDVIVDAKLRRFSAMWCLREAFVKMTGDALMAPWLKKLEILDVRAPRSEQTLDDDVIDPHDKELEEGEMVTDFRIFLGERRLNDVSMEIVALGKNFMVAGAVRGPEGMKADDECLKLGSWNYVGLDDILYVARANSMLNPTKQIP